MFEKNALAYRIKYKFNICELYAPHITLIFLYPPAIYLFCPLASQYCLHQLSGALRVIHLSRYNRRSVPGVVCFALWLHYTPAAANVKQNIAQNSMIFFMQYKQKNKTVKQKRGLLPALPCCLLVFQRFSNPPEHFCYLLQDR